MNKVAALLVIPLLSSTAWANVEITAQGNIATEQCAYGRGAPAIGEAEAKGAAAIATFISQLRVLSATEVSDTLNTETESWLNQLSELSQSGLQVSSLPLKIGSPRLQGSDTCVTVSLAQGALPAAVPMDNVTWDDASQSVTVIVVGEGWAEHGQTARNQAETDALRRAVSQVVGMWVSQQRSEFSTTNLRAQGDQETYALEELVAQQLHTRSDGLVREWQLLDSKELADNGIEVTIQAVVEKAPIIQASDDILRSIGSPRVRVEAPAPLRVSLLRWLNDQGIEVSEDANLVVRADAQLRQSGNNTRLDLSVFVEDLEQNQYAAWRNNPSLLALPHSSHVEQDLIDVHLAAPAQLDELQQELQTGFIQVVAQGGLVREVSLPAKYLAQPERLYAIISTMGGVKDVVVAQHQQSWRISMRYAGATGELIAGLQQSLTPILSAPLPPPKIMDDYAIRYH